MNNYIIYMHYNTISGKSYIGLTNKTIDERFKRHIYESKSEVYGTYHNNFKRALRKYPLDSWESITLEADIDTIEIAKQKEIQWIQYFDTFTGEGYNMTPGGDGRNCKQSDETKRKISENNIGKHLLTEAQKANLSEKAKYRHKHNIGNSWTDETNQKRSNTLKGRNTNPGMKHTDEFKKKRSAKYTGAGNPNYGKAMRDDTKDKISKSHANGKVDTCPHCGRTGKVRNLKPHHFDNCKHKK